MKKNLVLLSILILALLIASCRLENETATTDEIAEVTIEENICSEEFYIHCKGLIDGLITLTTTRSVWWSLDYEPEENPFPPPTVTTQEVALQDHIIIEHVHLTIMGIQDEYIFVHFEGTTYIGPWYGAGVSVAPQGGWTAEIPLGEPYRIGTDWGTDGINWSFVFELKNGINTDF